MHHGTPEEEQSQSLPAPGPRNFASLQTTQKEAASQLAPFWSRLGLCILVVAGLGLGLGLPSNGSLPWPVDRLAQVAGWLYTTAWSLSFYPQFIINFQRKSVVGFSLDFAVINTIGFVCLSIYYAAFAWHPVVRQKYRDVYGDDSSVRTNDVIFALHAAMLCALTLGQCAMYERGQQRVSGICQLAVAGIAALVITHALLVLVSDVSILSWLYVLSLVKLGVTVCKYVPQVLLNMRRKSTAGWSVQQVLLDFFGGWLSLWQLLLEAIVLRDVTLVTGDPIKLLLGLVSMFYDSILLLQHYWLYPFARAGKPSDQGAEAKDTDDEEAQPFAQS